MTMSSGFSQMYNFCSPARVSMFPFLPSIVPRPRRAGTSLFSNIDPSYVAFPSSETPIGTVALRLM
eukprot:8373031-Prorocentrum_lima.AAC.1